MARSPTRSVTLVTHRPLSPVYFAGTHARAHTHTVYMGACVTSVTAHWGLCLPPEGSGRGPQCWPSCAQAVAARYAVSGVRAGDPVIFCRFGNAGALMRRHIATPEVTIDALADPGA